MDLHVDRSEGRPVYRQIADQIREAVGNGRLAEGARLPTIRELARSLGVNRDTVGLAYEALAAEGVVDATVGRGTFVRSAAREPSAPMAAVRPGFSSVVERLLDFERGRPSYPAGQDSVPLHALVPDPSLFPVEPFRRAVNRAFADAGSSLLVYGGPQGHLGLREVLAGRLRDYGMRASAEDLVLCHGASQGISLAMRLFADSGDAVAVEEPTYHNALGTLTGLGIRPVPVPMRADGPDLAVLERVLAREDVKLFYTIPTFHNPMGTTTSLAHREALLAIARRRGKPVVEDAYEMDLRFDGRPVPPLAALDDEGLVVQLFSFSKSLFPGVRVGAVIADGRATDALVALKHATDLGGALPLQAALADFVRTGGYDRHLASLRRHLKSRRDAMLETLEAEMPEGVGWTRPDGGYQVWVELPEPLDARNLYADGLRAGVLVAPGDQFHCDGRPSRALRLTLALADEEAIRRGVTLLARLVRERLAAGPAATRSASIHI